MGLIFRRKKRWASVNYGERAGGQNPSMILIHYTGMQSAEAALERLCEHAGEVSAHYLIDETGELHSLVPENKRAWHAGKAYWAGETDINSVSIGIELVNPGHEFGYRPFPEAQITSLIVLCQGLMKRYAIPAARVLGHSDVAPGRKIDPGELFPWQKLAEQSVGLWPAPEHVDYENVSKHEAMDLLVQYGYDPNLELPALLTEFHRHFYPEAFRDNPADMHEEGIARLRSLIRQERQRRPS